LPIREDFVDQLPTRIEDASESREIDPEGKFDRDYKVSDKRHRNTLQHFSHWYEILTHRFMLIIFVLVITLIHLATKYVAIKTGDVLFLKISEDSWSFLTYAGVVILSHVITVFLERGRE
jgi:hypothetical protein